MTLENLACFGCGERGHLQKDCPDHDLDTPGRPPWCRTCDPRTRLVARTPDGPFTRCPDCHPLRHQMLPQHKRCRGCRAVIYAWDDNPCSRHIPLAIRDHA